MRKRYGLKGLAVLALCVPVMLLSSCMSTREYLKTQKTLYEDDVVIEETSQLSRDGKILETTNTKYYDLAEVCTEMRSDGETMTMDTFTAVKESSSKKTSDTITFSLVEHRSDKAGRKAESVVLGKKTVQVKEGKLVSDVSDIKGDKFSEEMEKVFSESVEKMVAAMYEKPSLEEDVLPAKKVQKHQEVAKSEKVIVQSVPNGKFIFYSVAGKPFVIAGVTAWNVLKCGGYALVNFLGGYNMVTGNGNGSFWVLPSFKKSREKAAVAKEANKIQYYPEYHLPFTNNHIIVEKYDRDISILALEGENAEEIVPVERFEYDNTMSVERSSKADAASTAAVGGVIGTVVTIPVSVTTWVGGAVLGVYSSINQ